MNVLSLFDGISCGRVALERANIKIDKYYASEVDKYATQISEKNYPNIIRLGDVKTCDIPKDIDILLAGFPCQSFSIAGNRKGFEDERGNLFFDLMRIFKEVKPKYFLFENVASMKKADREKLDEIIGVKSIMVNSALVSAQQRKRLYWTNIPFGQPEDKSIYLQDILENDENNKLSKYYLSESTFHNFKIKQFYLDDNSNQTERIGQLNSGGQGDRVYSVNGKSVSLSANGGGRGAKTGLYLIVREATKKGFVEIAPNCGVDLTQPNSKTRRGRKMEFKSNCLMTGSTQYCWNNGFVIRKLTPMECDRLQTLPDNYTEGVSDTQRYKQCGNGWTVDVIAHILKGIK